MYVLRSAVGKTHDLRSDLWWTIPLRILLDQFWDTQKSTPRWTATVRFFWQRLYHYFFIRQEEKIERYSEAARKDQSAQKETSSLPTSLQQTNDSDYPSLDVHIPNELLPAPKATSVSHDNKAELSHKLKRKRGRPRKVRPTEEEAIRDLCDR